MQFRKDRGQDEKDMAKLLGLKLRIFSLDEREAFAFSRNDNFSSTQLHNPYGVGKLSISRAKTYNFSSVGCEKKNLRLSIGRFEQKIFLARDGTFFFISFLRHLSVAPYLQNAPVILVCSTQPCVFEGKARI